MFRSLIWILIFGFAPGCAEDIGFESPDASGPGDAAPSARHTTIRAGDGTYTTTVDATSTTEWIHGDFETGAEVGLAGPWDLRFQRFHISLNGGSSGSGGVEIAPVPGLAFAQVTSAPATGWLTDAVDGEDANTDPDYAFEQGDGWYDYDPITHVLTPKPLVWAIRTNGGSTIKLEITSYYDEAGTAGWFRLHWGAL